MDRSLRTRSAHEDCGQRLTGNHVLNPVEADRREVLQAAGRRQCAVEEGQSPLMRIDWPCIHISQLQFFQCKYRMLFQNSY